MFLNWGGLTADRVMALPKTACLILIQLLVLFGGVHVWRVRFRK